MGSLSLGELAAVAATALALASMAPQMLRLWRTRNASGVALSTATVGVVSEVAWIGYTIDGGLWSAVPESALSTLVNVMLTVAVLRSNVPFGKAATFAAGWGGVLVLGVALGGSELLAALLPCAFAVQLAPSVWTVYRSSSPTGVAASTWTMVGVESVLWSAYGLAESNAAFVALGCFGVIASLAILARLVATQPPRVSASSPRPILAA